MAVIGYCAACDKPLTGKQRDWCSDACRKRHGRASTNNPALSVNRPLSSTDVRESSGFVREASAISYILVVRYKDNGFGDVNRSMDSWALKNNFNEHLTKSALKWLETNFNKWTFEVVSVEVRRK